MKYVRWLTGQWKLLASALIAAAIVHIWLTLSAAQNTASPGYADLVENMPINQITYLPPVTPKHQPLPFMMPDARYAICRFDATAGAIRLQAVLPDTGWSLSLHAPNGANFYFVPGSSSRVTKLDLTLQPAGYSYLAPPETGRRNKVQRPKVLLPQSEGIAVLKAPVKGLAYRRQVDEQLNAFSCRPIPQAVARR